MAIFTFRLVGVPPLPDEELDVMFASLNVIDEPVIPPRVGSAEPNWAALVARIQQHDPSAMEELYQVFNKGMRYYLCRQLGSQDLDDKVHDCFLVVVQAIRRGELRDPERLIGFAHTIVRRQIAGHIDVAVHQRKHHVDLPPGVPLPELGLSPEASLLTKQEEQIALSVLKSISKRQREILTRFYLKEQTREQICAEMKLSDTQFRLIKSRAKARFGELGRRRLSSRGSTLFHGSSPKTEIGDQRPSRKPVASVKTSSFLGRFETEADRAKVHL